VAFGGCGLSGGRLGVFGRQRPPERGDAPAVCAVLPGAPPRAAARGSQRRPLPITYGRIVALATPLARRSLSASWRLGQRWVGSWLWRHFELHQR
jgi:hypothetical protein